jgi:hypothetical protein
MSEWSDPDFDKIYEANNAKDVGDGFKDVHKKLADRQPSAMTASDKDLIAIQHNFHNLMRYRCRRAADCLKWLDDNKDSLPVITNELLDKSEVEWFAVAGMYGGFAYGLFEREGRPVLITDSWIRIVGGSGEQHEITPTKVELVVKGFAQ